VGLSCVLTTGTATECHSDPTCSTVKPFRRQPESWEVHSAGPPPPLRRVRGGAEHAAACETAVLQSGDWL
jgi:hypothetical protein